MLDDNYPYDKTYTVDMYRALSAALLKVTHANHGIKTIEAVDALLLLAINTVGAQSDDAEQWVGERQAIRTGISLYEAGEILARLRARFRVFEDWTKRVADRAGLDMEISTPLGWVMQCPPGINPRTVRNFPIQSTGSEILHVACVLAERRGIRLVAPVHDAIMAEAPIEQAEDVSTALDRTMRDAAAVVLRGYELPTDVQMVRPGQRYFDERGEAMWNTINKLIAKREAQTA
jgi:hypothetical protein